MSGRTARAARRQRQQSGTFTAAALRTGLPGPGEYTLRLARPDEAPAVGALIDLAGVAEPVILDAIGREGRCSSVALAALESPERGLRTLGEYLMRNDVQGALQASSVAMVAVHPECPDPVAAVLTSPPGAVMRQVQGNFNAVMMLMVEVAKVSVLATHPEHRRAGLGSALLLQATALAHRVGRGTVYGTTRVADHLGDWYRRRGLEVREPGAGLDLSWLVERPFAISPLPQEQMFVSTRRSPARLASSR